MLVSSVTTVNTKSWFLWLWLIHSTNDLTHIVKAKGTAVSAYAMKEYRGADVQIYSFFPFGSRQMRVVRFIHQLCGIAHSNSWIGSWVGTKTSVDNLKKIKTTVIARNWALDCPAHNIATVLTEIFQLFSTNMKDISKYSDTDFQKTPCISPE